MKYVHEAEIGLTETKIRRNWIANFCVFFVFLVSMPAQASSQIEAANR